MGLAYIAAVLEQDHEVSVIDAVAEGWRNLKVDKLKYSLGLEYDEVASRVRRISPHVVGIAALSSQSAESVFEVARAVKEVDKDIVVVVGGPHASVRPVDCLRRGNIDFVVVGEGENTIRQFIQVLETGARKEFKSINGIAYLEDGQPVITPRRQLIKDLDSLPFPAWHLFPTDAYLRAARGYHRLAVRSDVSKPWAPIITSRGCPYGCVFCSVRLTMGRGWRPRTPGNVVRELEQLYQKYAVRQIDFNDDNLTLDKQRMHQICDRMMEKGLDVDWYTPNGVRADTLDKDLLVKMKASGLKELWVSPESGVQRVVDDIVKKKLDLTSVERAIAFCKELGVEVNCFFVMGLIGETKEDILQTIQYAGRLKRLGAGFISIGVAVPYYGTQLYEQAKERGYLAEAFSSDELIATEATIETPEFTAKELHELYMQAQATLNPSFKLTRSHFSWTFIALVLRNPWAMLRVVLTKMRYLLKAKLGRI
jgi:magnesium-protoporphyrin IX monomethyl ester (oxidative) cyclase